MSPGFRGVIGVVWLLLASCSSMDDGSDPPPIDPVVTTGVSAAEEAVYAAVLSQRYPASTYVVMDQTATEVPGGSLAETLDRALAHLTGVATATSLSFIEHNQHPLSLSPEMQLGVPYVLVSDAEVMAVFAMGVDSGWEAFYTRYPGAHGLIRLSRVGFNPAMDQALLYVGNQYGGLGGEGMYFLLLWNGVGWMVNQETLVWIS